MQSSILLRQSAQVSRVNFPLPLVSWAFSGCVNIQFSNHIDKLSWHCMALHCEPGTGTAARSIGSLSAGTSALPVMQAIFTERCLKE